jgi:spermidine synthase
MAMSILGAVALAAALLLHVTLNDRNVVLRARSFYAIVKVRLRDLGDGKESYELVHGTTTHGLQLVSARDRATGYYSEMSGIGLAIRFLSHQHARLNVGAIGLGIGTVAAYSRVNDLFRFYEINPDIVRLASGRGGYFTFLTDARGKVEIVEGDARLSLQAERDRGDNPLFDLLVIDAFNGEALPTHLLTLEAMQLYLDRLRDSDSIIAVHVSNKLFDLEPLMRGLARELDLNATLVRHTENKPWVYASDWVLLSRQQLTFNVGSPASDNMWLRIRPLRKVRPIVWTDNYSSLVPLLVY